MSEADVIQEFLTQSHRNATANEQHQFFEILTPINKFITSSQNNWNAFLHYPLRQSYTMICSRSGILFLSSLFLHGQSSAYIISTKDAPSSSSVTQSAYERYAAARKERDTTKIGTIEVPNVGIGTISWSSDDCKFGGNMFCVHDYKTKSHT